MKFIAAAELVAEVEVVYRHNGSCIFGSHALYCCVASIAAALALLFYHDYCCTFSYKQQLMQTLQFATQRRTEKCRQSGTREHDLCRGGPVWEFPEHNRLNKMDCSGNKLLYKGTKVGDFWNFGE